MGNGANNGGKEHTAGLVRVGRHLRLASHYHREEYTASMTTMMDIHYFMVVEDQEQDYYAITSLSVYSFEVDNIHEYDYDEVS
jgi:hypothetical protein